MYGEQRGIVKVRADLQRYMDASNLENEIQRIAQEYNKLNTYFYNGYQGSDKGYMVSFTDKSMFYKDTGINKLFASVDLYLPHCRGNMQAALELQAENLLEAQQAAAERRALKTEQNRKIKQEQQDAEQARVAKAAEKQLQAKKASMEAGKAKRQQQRVESAAVAAESKPAAAAASAAAPTLNLAGLFATLSEEQLKAIGLAKAEPVVSDQPASGDVEEAIDEQSSTADGAEAEAEAEQPPAPSRKKTTAGKPKAKTAGAKRKKRAADDEDNEEFVSITEAAGEASAGAGGAEARPKRTRRS